MSSRRQRRRSDRKKSCMVIPMPAAGLAAVLGRRRTHSEDGECRIGKDLPEAVDR